MTANVTIVVEQRDNILLVPNRAVKTTGKQKIVTVLKDGKPTPVTVTLGMSNDTQSEVTSGLNEGDVVVVPQTTTTTSGGGGGGGFGGPAVDSVGRVDSGQEIDVLRLTREVRLWQ